MTAQFKGHTIKEEKRFAERKGGGGGGDKCRKTQQDVKLMFFTLIPHLFPPKSGMLITPGLCWWRPERDGGVGGEGGGRGVTR